MEHDPGRNDPCWCGSNKKYKKCHADFDDRLYEYREQGFMIPPRDIIKTEEQVDGIRTSGLLNIKVLDHVAQQIRAGMSTQDIDRIVYETTVQGGGIPAPLNYEGFPKSVCTSVNSQVCHGIPSQEDILKEGDIINVDVSTILHGYYSDSSRMFCIGTVTESAQKLVDDVKKCVEEGIRRVKPWTPIGNVGAAVHRVAKENGYSVVEEIGGHGVGLEFHEEPFVSFVAEEGTGMLMVPGMVFTIEPMVNMGKGRVFTDHDNGWTVYTADRQLSAQWEVTVAVTEEGCEILAY